MKLKRQFKLKTIEEINEIKIALHKESPIQQPVDCVLWVPIEKVEPNDYNPNAVATVEMGLLYKSIKKDGYTQPIVTIYDADRDKYIIVDGFHRYYVCKTKKDIYEANSGMVPIVIIKKSISERMAATVRHNRARGEHSIDGMSNLVFKMLDEGMSDADVCNELGMEPEELLKLKHLTGFSKLFANTEYKMAWETKNQIIERMKYEKATKS